MQSKGDLALVGICSAHEHWVDHQTSSPNYRRLAPFHVFHAFRSGHVINEQELNIRRNTLGEAVFEVGYAFTEAALLFRCASVKNERA